MRLYLNEDESGKLGGKRAIVPKEVSDEINAQLSKFGNIPAVHKLKGYKRAKTLTTPGYNDRAVVGKDVTSDGRKIVSFGDLKRISHDLSKIPNNDENLAYLIQGGDTTRNWAKETADRIRNSEKSLVPKVKPVPSPSNLGVKQVKPVPKPGGVNEMRKNKTIIVSNKQMDTVLS